MPANNIIPPLLGNGKGRYGVWIIGNSGTGKSTLGCWLAALLMVPHIPLDEIYWRPGWQPIPQVDFQARIKAAMEENQRGWVIDGEYDEAHGIMIEREATDIIWLDPPLILYFTRILVRTLLRLFSVRPPCSPGCPETWKEVLSTRGILWWCLSHHWTVRKKNGDRMRECDAQDGGQMRRLGGFGGELKDWKQAVTFMVKCGLGD